MDEVESAALRSARERGVGEPVCAGAEVQTSPPGPPDTSLGVPCALASKETLPAAPVLSAPCSGRLLRRGRRIQKSAGASKAFEIKELKTKDGVTPLPPSPEIAIIGEPGEPHPNPHTASQFVRFRF